jgi:hypothetical protein
MIFYWNICKIPINHPGILHGAFLIYNISRQGRMKGKWIYQYRTEAINNVCLYPIRKLSYEDFARNKRKLRQKTLTYFEYTLILSCKSDWRR